MLKRTVIINPVIIKKSDPIEIEELCLSFPFREPKKTIRYDKIRVNYSVKTFFGIKTITEDKQGVIAHIFQQAVELMRGENPYFKSENPIKWWELYGNKKPGSFTSLDKLPEDMKPNRIIAKYGKDK